MPGNIEDVNFDIAGEGRCFIYNLSYNGTINGLSVNSNISSLSGDFDFSNSIDVIRNVEITEGPTEEVTYENVVYNEAVDGDLSGDNNATTAVTLAPGDNRVISSQQGSVDQANFFTFQVPAGYEFSQLIVDSYEGADAIGFIGLDEGNVISGVPTSNAPSRLIGGLSYGTANVGSDILPEMGDANNPAAGFVDGFGFTAPLASGEYTIWLNQTGGLSTTVLNIVLTSAEVGPQPQNVDGGTITGGPYTFTVGDGIADNVSGVSVSGNVGANSQWVVTDDQRNILGLPPTPEAVDFDGAGAGTCFIYHLSYEDGLTGLAADNNLSELVGNFDLSNRVEVVRNLVVDPGTEVDCNYDIQRSLPTTYESYGYAFVIGTNGPSITDLTRLTISWDSANNGLYQFAFHYNRSPWYSDFSNATQSFNQANPTINLVGTSIAGLDGQYAIANEGGNIVLVADTYSIYFSHSSVAPNCGEVLSKNVEDANKFVLYPNPADTSFTLADKEDLQGSTISISDLSGAVIFETTVEENTTSVDINISDVSAGLYLVQINTPNGISVLEKLIVE